jgi:hypothetical protein
LTIRFFAVAFGSAFAAFMGFDRRGRVFFGRAFVLLCFAFAMCTPLAGRRLRRSG